MICNPMSYLHSSSINLPTVLLVTIRERHNVRGSVIVLSADHKHRLSSYESMMVFVCMGASLQGQLTL